MPRCRLIVGTMWMALLVSACPLGTHGPRPSGYAVFAQEFEFHGLPLTIKPGTFAIDFSNEESFPVSHEMVVVRLPAGKTVLDVAESAKASGCQDGAPCEEEWQHVGAIRDVHTGITQKGVFDLRPGTYAFVWWRTGTQQGRENGPAHASLGMVFEFDVSS